MSEENWIVISTHLDDVALSCGALIWDLTRREHNVAVWTIMAGFPTNEIYSEFAQQNHREWGKSGAEAIEMRREEDRAACQVMGAACRHFDYPDVIYRDNLETGEPMVNNDDELFGKPPDNWLVHEVAEMLQREIPERSKLVLPIGLGGHIDHRVVAAAGMYYDRVQYYYADYPYILNEFDSPMLTSGDLGKIERDLSEDALTAWQNAVLCYRSQLSAFWRDDDEARLALRNYLSGGGGRLWVKTD
jgi:LmbE family N-acetylglucosaminyl deacetylase